MSTIIFGPGKGYVVKTGVAPRKVADLSEFSVTESKDTVEFFGDQKVAKDAAVIKVTMSATAKVFGLTPSDMANFVDGTRTTGSERIIEAEAGVIPATPYQITVDESATFVRDLGVYNVTNSAAMTWVASSPATGQYSVTAGVYEFAAADEGDSVTIAYSYTDSVNGEMVTVSNEATVQCEFFEIWATNKHDGETTIRCYRCYFKSMDPLYGAKLNEFQSEYTATIGLIADSSGNYFKISSIPAA